MNKIQIAEVTHYYNRIGVAVLALTETIHVGDMVHITGYSTDFRQRVTSLQVEHQAVDSAVPGQDVALKVDQRVRQRDKVYKVGGSD